MSRSTAIIAGLLAAWAGAAAWAMPPGVPDVGGRCEDCHTPSGWDVLPEKMDFDHARTGFPLRDRHAEATCTDCHGDGLRTSGTRATCASCHRDPHRDAQGPACEGCHTARDWRPDDMLLRHRSSRFPLMGVHAAADCTSCHVRNRQETYRGTPTACFACHADDYRRPGIHPDHVAAGFRTTCDSCHTQVVWSPARVKHSLYWPLRGAHAAADCVSCHAGGRYGGTPTTCFDCHDDDYRAAADPPHAAYAVSTRCARCHSETAWEATRSRWHDGAFRISGGAHSGFTCGECHFEGALPPANFTCIGCHERGETDREHLGEVSGYVWENFACYGCHPSGGE